MNRFIILFLLFFVTACASDKADSSKEDKSDKQAETKLNTDDLICPQVAILVDAQNHVDYGGEKPNEDQLVASARMINVEGDCAYRKNGIDISFTLHMSARRGPRLGGDQVNFPFYVAVIDPSENILNRQLITARFSFSDNRHAGDDEKMHVFIPLTKDALQGGPSYRVLMGFQK